MKQIQHYLLMLLPLCMLVLNANAQTASVASLPSSGGLQLSLKGGYDIVPMYNNNTPYIKYKGDLSTGISLDYYFKNWGIGVDADYIKNKPKNTLNTAGLINPGGTALTTFSTTEKNITRTFFGIGPSYKHLTPGKKLMWETNARVGLSSIKGGYTELKETTTILKDVLNFHAGYNVKAALSGKLQLKGTYFLQNNIGIQVGAYYLNHFKTVELVDPVYGFAAKFQPLQSTASGSIYSGGYNVRTNSCHCDVASIGVFAGVVIKFGRHKKLDPDKCPPEYNLVVTAKDKITGAVLPNTLVTIQSKTGTNNLSGITNNYGVVVFENIKPYNYQIEGTLAETALEGNNAVTDEFAKRKTVQKTILYTSNNFAITGKIFECNSTKAIGGIQIVLENADKGIKKTTTTNTDGSFVITMPQTGTFSLYGKKGNYFSQIEIVNADNYNRSKNLFVQLEICAQRADCGQAILLKNIQYDLDKFFIRPDAQPELNKLLRFMIDNPAIIVELSSHTDSRASSEYNNTLSQNRANAAVDYLVSKGISRSRLIAKGYGETKLLNECADEVNCSEEKHQLNRRTEMKVICNIK